MIKQDKQKKKTSYSYQIAECDNEAMKNIMFIRNKLLVDFAYKAVLKSSANLSSNLQDGERSREAQLQPAGK